MRSFDRAERQAAALQRLLAQAIADTAKERLREIDKHTREGQ